MKWLSTERAEKELVWPGGPLSTVLSRGGVLLTLPTNSTLIWMQMFLVEVVAG